MLCKTCIFPFYLFDMQISVLTYFSSKEMYGNRHEKWVLVKKKSVFAADYRMTKKTEDTKKKAAEWLVKRKNMLSKCFFLSLRETITAVKVRIIQHIDPIRRTFFSLVCTKSIIQQQILSKSKFIYGIYTLCFSLLIFRPD